MSGRDVLKCRWRPLRNCVVSQGCEQFSRVHTNVLISPASGELWPELRCRKPNTSTSVLVSSGYRGMGAAGALPIPTSNLSTNAYANPKPGPDPATNQTTHNAAHDSKYHLLHVVPPIPVPRSGEHIRMIESILWYE